MVAYLLIYFNYYYYCIDIINNMLKNKYINFCYINLIIKPIMNKFTSIKNFVEKRFGAAKFSFPPV